MSDSTGIIYSIGLLIFGLVLMAIGLVLRHRYKHQKKTTKRSGSDPDTSGP